MAEIDDFWDIASLMPKKKKTVAPSLPKEDRLPVMMEEKAEEKSDFSKKHLLL